MNNMRLDTNYEETESEDCNTESDEDCNPVENERNLYSQSDSYSDISEIDDDETQFNEIIDDNLSMLSKDGNMWYASPICNENTKVKISNIIKLRPGLTRYSKSHVNELKDAFLLFFPPSIENLILDSSNCYGRAIHGDKHRFKIITCISYSFDSELCFEVSYLLFFPLL